MGGKVNSKRGENKNKNRHTRTIKAMHNKRVKKSAREETLERRRKESEEKESETKGHGKEWDGTGIGKRVGGKKRERGRKKK